jgi:NADH:ubiquinone oxidoreductase subunit E
MRLKKDLNNKVGAAMVVGGGIGGMQAALDLAESGIKIYLVDSKPSIGGVMAQLDKTFPTNDCAMCTMAPRLVEIGRHKDIELVTFSEVDNISGEAGNFKVTVKKKPRYVDVDKCTGCGACVSNCPTRNSVQIIEPRRIELASDFRATVNSILSNHKDREGPLMPILQDINAAFNYFPADVLSYVSQETGLPLTHIYRIATFYSSFSMTPRGKNIINVCMGTTCYVKGSGRVMEEFSNVLGVKPNQTTADMNYTLKEVRCLGCCGLAPAAMIGDDAFGKLAIKDVSKVIRKCRES